MGVANFYFGMQKTHLHVCTAQVFVHHRVSPVEYLAVWCLYLYCKDCKRCGSCLKNFDHLKKWVQYFKLGCFTLVICKYTFFWLVIVIVHIFTNRFNPKRRYQVLYSKALTLQWRETPCVPGKNPIGFDKTCFWNQTYTCLDAAACV